MQASVAELKRIACATFKVQEVDVDLYDFFKHEKLKNLEQCLDKTLDEVRILDEQPVLLEDKQVMSSSVLNKFAGV